MIRAASPKGHVACEMEYVSGCNRDFTMQEPHVSRRRFLTYLGGAATVLTTRSDAARPVETDCPASGRTLRCRPLISGALRQYDPSFSAVKGKSGWMRELDDERNIGFDLLWLSNVSSALSFSGTGDPLLDLLDLCAERRLSVILDTGCTGHWYIAPDIREETRVVRGNVTEIARRYGQHPAFYAWYVPHEIYVAYDQFGVFMSELYPTIVQMCKQAAPGKIVTLSPFFILDKDRVFGDFRYAEPDEYGHYWADLIRRSGFDVIMLQDSGEHFSYVTNKQRRPFFAAMRTACDSAGARLWGNVETAEFECPSIEEYVLRYGRVHHATVKDAPWRPVPMDRLESKLRLAAAFCERIVTWGYYEFCRPHLNARAAQWYADYRKYYQRQSARSRLKMGNARIPATVSPAR